MGKRSCIFCGAAKVSDEHVFSDWIKQVMPDVASQQRSTHTGTLTALQSGVTAVTTRDVPLTVLETRVKRVCAPCNSGWMSEIDAQAKKYLELMIPGQQELELDRTALGALAKWVYLKTLMYEFVQRPTQVGNVDEWHEFYTTRTLPSNLAVWVGPQKAENWSWETRMATLSMAVPDASDSPFVRHYTMATLPLNTLTATLGLGSFFAQLFFARYPDRVGWVSRITDADDAFATVGVQQIWSSPPHSLRWDPVSSGLVNEENISLAASYIYRGLSGHTSPI